MAHKDPIPELTSAQRDRFDEILEDAIGALPPNVRALLDQVPVIVLDEPTPELIALLRNDGTLLPDEDGLDLCGLHSGVAITDRSVEDPGGWGEWSAQMGGMGGPEQIHIFRRGVADLAVAELEGGWDDTQAEQEIYEEVRITLLHEIGHHFGLGEEDLDELGFA